MLVKGYVLNKELKYLWIVLMMAVVTIYGIENSGLTTIMGSYRYNYILKPSLWIGLGIIVWKLPNVRPRSKLKHRGNINLWAFNFAVIFIIVSVIAGLFEGIGRSPYNHSISGIIHNLVFVAPKLVAMELVRNYLVNRLTKTEKYIVFILIALFMTMVSFQLSRFTRLTDYESIIQFIGQFFAPEFSHNILATYLAFVGGLMPPIIYMGLIQAFYWLSPILPDLKWITVALIGTLAPMFFLLSIQNIYLVQSKKVKAREKEKESPLSWMITSFFSILIVWFAVGVFPIYPSAIATGSMEPMIYPGDVILVHQNIAISELEVGDVIQFQRGSILISHRIVDIEEEKGAITGFKTKGDNNSVADSELVKPEYVRGKIVQVVPKVGWPTLLVRSRKDINLDEIVF